MVRSTTAQNFFGPVTMTAAQAFLKPWDLPTASYIMRAMTLMMPLILLLGLQAPGPEQKAVSYMVSEVPRWPMENHCFSCHNNGDGARALYLAYRLKYPVSAEALEGTSNWLQKPTEWGKSGETGFSLPLLWSTRWMPVS